MKIFLIGYHPDLFWKGSSTLYYQNSLAKYLQRHAEHSVVLYYPYRRQNIFKYLFSPLVESTDGEKRILEGGLISFGLDLLKVDDGILHFVVIRRYMIWVLMWARTFGIKTVLTLHDTLFLQNKITKQRKLKNLMVRLANAIFVQNLFDKNVVRLCKAEPDIHILKLGISNAESMRDLNIKSEEILFAGGLGLSYKGLDFLEAALKKIHYQHKLIICGENENNQSHLNYIGTLDRNEFKKLLGTVRMVIVPSKYESFGMIALEAIAIGTPLIITDTCGISEYLEDGINCLKVKYGDIEDLAKKISMLLTDDLLCEKLKQNGIKTANRFLWEDIIEEYIKSYKNIVRRKILI